MSFNLIKRMESIFLIGLEISFTFKFFKILFIFFDNDADVTHPNIPLLEAEGDMLNFIAVASNHFTN